MSTTQAPHSAAEQFELRRRSPVQRVQHLLHSYPAISPALVLVFAYIVFSLADSRMATLGVTSVIIGQVAVVAALAVGQTLIILTAGIDLSVGAISILSVAVMAKLATENGVPALLALLAGIAVGGLAGLANGLLVTRLNLPPFIVTLGTFSIFTALGLLYTKGRSIDDDDMPGLLSWTGTRIEIGELRITTGALIVLALFLVVGFALSQTAWGRHVYAVGDDAEGARLAGISVQRVLLSVYAVAGLIFGLTAWVLIGRAGAASPNSLIDANLQSITAVVIGGTSLFGGRGALIGTLLGALIVGVFETGLSLVGVDNQWRVLAVGTLIIVAVSIDQWIRTVRS
jgi:fructose transport system permease protein